jgi:hypothetical protein
MSIRISDKASGRALAAISEQDLAILVGHMEEESSTDQDYFVEHTAVDALEQQGASSEFVAALREAIGSSEGIDIAWSRE